MSHNPHTPPARQGQSCSCPHLDGELLLFPVPLCFLPWIPRDSHCHWVMLLCSIDGLFVEGRAGQEVLGNIVLTHAFQGTKRCPPTHTGPHPFCPHAGALSSWRAVQD